MTRSKNTTQKRAITKRNIGKRHIPIERKKKHHRIEKIHGHRSVEMIISGQDETMAVERELERQMQKERDFLFFIRCYDNSIIILFSHQLQKIEKWSRKHSSFLTVQTSLYIFHYSKARSNYFTTIAKLNGHSSLAQRAWVEKLVIFCQFDSLINVKIFYSFLTNASREFIGICLHEYGCIFCLDNQHFSIFKVLVNKV